MLSEVTKLKKPLEIIQSETKLCCDYCQSEEIINLYACLLGIIRFLEGVSWGFSKMLMHFNPDKETILTVKVIFNHLLSIKQDFRENLKFCEALNLFDI